MGTWGLQDVGPSLCPVMVHVVQGCGIQACVHSWSWAALLPQHCTVTTCCTVTNQQHCLALLLSCHELSTEGKGKRSQEGLPLGHPPAPGALRAGSGGKGKAPLPGSGRSCRAPSTRCRSGGRDSKSKQGSHHTSASSAMQPSPAHTDMQHRNALLSTPGVPGPCTGSTAAGTDCSLGGCVPCAVPQAQPWPREASWSQAVPLAGHPLRRTWAEFLLNGSPVGLA